MKARFLPLLAFVAMLPACAARPSAPTSALPPARPEIVIHAPLERVRRSIITQEIGEDRAILDGASEHRLSFAKQVSKPVTEVLDDLKPSGAPYVRKTYVLTGEAHDIYVSLHSEIISNYGTVTASARPLDTREVRQTEQRDLLRLRVIVEGR